MSTPSKIHVAFCGAAFRDHRQLRRCEDSGQATEPWPVPKTAREGDHLVFYNSDKEKAFLATGIVAAEPEPDGTEAHHSYRAPIDQIRMLKVPLSLDEARRKFPDWAWLRYTRNVTTLRTGADKFWRHLHGREPRRSEETASRAKSLFGDRPYQARARAALPLLVTAAQQGAKLYYEDLADQLGITNPRVLNYVLGSVGQTLIELSRRWDERIPPIQCLVVNQRQELPGEGVGFFIDKAKYREMSAKQKRRLVDKIHDVIWAYPKWDEVLSALRLEVASTAKTKATKKVARFQGGGFGDPLSNRLVERAAIHAVKRRLRRDGYRVKSRELECIGYDLEAIRRDSILHVEVKGVSGHVEEFLITRGEKNKASTDPFFKLCVVTRALTAKPLLHFFLGSELDKTFTFEPTAFRAVLR
jgi:hypothetical protein